MHSLTLLSLALSLKAQKIRGVTLNARSTPRINTPVTKLSLAAKADDQAKKDALPAATDAMHGNKHLEKLWSKPNK